VCPIYSKVGGHKYGHVYIGAIGLILTLFYHGSENDRAIVRNCINCHMCKEVCPVGIDLPHLIKKTYAEVMRQEGKKPLKNFLLSNVMKNRRLFHFILRQAYLAQKPLAKDAPMIRHLPHFFEKRHGFRSLPTIAKSPFRSQWKSLRFQADQPKHRIALFAGCAMDFIYPEHGKAFLDLLRGGNVRVDFPEDQTCCGLPVLMAAEEDAARELAIQNIRAFSPESYDYILTLCASCASHLKHNYQKLFAGRSDAPENLKAFTDKITDFSSFMVNVLKVSPEQFSGSGKPFDKLRPRKVAYHSPCHLCRGLHVTEEPRKLIEIGGNQYVPSDDEDVCCGFGGSYSVDFPEISAEILRKKLDNVEKTDAEVLVTDCPGCVLQLQGGMDRRGSKVQVRHIAEVLVRR